MHVFIIVFIDVAFKKMNLTLGSKKEKFDFRAAFVHE